MVTHPWLDLSSFHSEPWNSITTAYMTVLLHRTVEQILLLTLASNFTYRLLSSVKLAAYVSYSRAVEKFFFFFHKHNSGGNRGKEGGFVL